MKGTSPSTAWSLSGLCLTMLMASLDTSIANAGLPTLARAFDASFSQVQWVVLAYLLALTAFIVSVGRLGDRIGRHRMLVGGIATFLLGSALAGFAPSLEILIAARVVQGLGAASMMGLSMAYVGEAVPKEKTGRAMGLLGTMSAIGTAVGPSLGGFLIASLGWRAIFLVGVPVGLVALTLTYRFLPRGGQEPAGHGRFDAFGTILLALTLTSYALAMSLGRGRFGVLNIMLLAGALLVGGVFIAFETRTPHPLLRLQMFCKPGRSGSLIMSLLVATVMMSTLVVGPFYLSRALALGPAMVGLIMSAGPAVVILVGVPAGRLTERFGARSVSTAGLGLMGVGALSMSLTSATFGIPGFVLPVIVLTAGYALFQTSNNTLIMTDVALDQRGVVSGMLGLSRNLGLVTGASAMGAIFSLASGAMDVASANPAAVADGLRITFAVAAALVAAALLIARAPNLRLVPGRHCKSVRMEVGDETMAPTS